MTIDEAIKYNKNLREYMRITDKNSEYKFLKENYEALDMAIKALEQEPCEDAVSRTLVHEAITASIAESENPYEMWQRIEALQPVTPTQKWIPVSERLPEKGGAYLVTIKWKGSYSGDVYTETNMAVYKEKEKEWDCAGIVAWMPIPEPYAPSN